MSLFSICIFPVRQVFKLALILVQVAFLLWFLFAAYDIRLYPIKDFGYIIHEFDPWFNYRAAEYMAEHGLSKFFKWYDYESWYPLGRPIGTTIYPGMQMTAVGIWEAHKQIPSISYNVPASILALRPYLAKLGKAGFMFMPKIPKVFTFAPMSVNDICCMMPPWFGSIASAFTGLLAFEISRSVNAGVITAGIMAIIPAHLMRSVGGEFDNEAVAVTAISSTFYLWLRCVRNPGSWPWAVLAGLSYAYMVAAWGGYIFVLNMVGMHALILVGLGRFNAGTYKAYTLFYIIGTYGAMQIPVVGWAPLRSLEQLGPLLVFFGYQVLAFSDYQRHRKNMSTADFVKFRIMAMVALLVVLAVIGVLLYPTGYFGPISSRIRGLFVKHTKTGNPLVDSVAEHQPANAGMYASYLNLPLDYAVIGGIISARKRNNGFYFLCLYALIAQHFSGKMSRLVLICGPIVSVACGIWCGFIMDQLIAPILLLLGKQGFKVPESVAALREEAPKEEKAGEKAKKDSGKKEKKKKAECKIELEEFEDEERPGGIAAAKRYVKRALFNTVPTPVVKQFYETRQFLDCNPLALLVRLALSLALVYYVHRDGKVQKKVSQFMRHCDQVARSLSNPQVVYMQRDRSGQNVIVDDYLKGYQWIEKNTPKDSRVMAWWDYGYQITGIAKRTSIADGNTWNHEHIATLGRTMTSPEVKAHKAIRHLADYVLVWAGGGGDDLAKSPHLARIGNSVFPDHCGDDDPKCRKFSFYEDYSPTPMMARSLLYKLCTHNVSPGVKLNEKLFKEVHTTKRGLMRVYKVMNVSQESKDWVADPKNRICDAPGSWYCVGQYPPALQKLIAKRRNFAQIEDFNKKDGAKSAYTKLVEQELAGSHGGEF